MSMSFFRIHCSFRFRYICLNKCFLLCQGKNHSMWQLNMSRFNCLKVSQKTRKCLKNSDWMSGTCTKAIVRKVQSRIILTEEAVGFNCTNYYYRVAATTIVLHRAKANRLIWLITQEMSFGCVTQWQSKKSCERRIDRDWLLPSRFCQSSIHYSYDQA